MSCFVPKIDRKFIIVLQRLFPLKIEVKISLGRLELLPFIKVANSVPS